MPIGGPDWDALAYRFWAIEEFRELTSGPRGKLNEHWTDQIRKDPLLLGMHMCIDMVFGGGQRLRVSTDPITAYRRTPASGPVTEIVYEPILMQQPRVNQQYSLGTGSSSARSFAISFAENNMNPYSIISEGRFIAGWAEVSLLIGNQDWELRYVLMLGDMSGGVTFGAVDEIIETEIVDPLETSDLLITPYTVQANTALSATWSALSTVMAGTVIADDIKINGTDIHTGSNIVVTAGDGTGTLAVAINALSSTTSVTSVATNGLMTLTARGGGEIDPQVKLEFTSNGGLILNGVPGAGSITQAGSTTVPESYVGYRYPLVFNSPVNVPAIRLSAATPPYFLCWFASDVTPSTVNVDGVDYGSANRYYPYTFSKVNDGTGANYWKVEFSTGDAVWEAEAPVNGGMTIFPGDIVIEGVDIMSANPNFILQANANGTNILNGTSDPILVNSTSSGWVAADNVNAGVLNPGDITVRGVDLVDSGSVSVQVDDNSSTLIAEFAERYTETGVIAFHVAHGSGYRIRLQFEGEEESGIQDDDIGGLLRSLINNVYNKTGVMATITGGKISLTKTNNTDIDLVTTARGGYILNGVWGEVKATTLGGWSDNTSVFVSGSRDGGAPDENIIKVIKRLCTNWSTLGHHGISDNLFAIAESKIPNIAKPAVIVNGSGGADSASAIEYIESTLCASFPMVSMAWGNGGYGPVVTDRTRGGIRMRLVAGQAPLLDRSTAIKETAKSSLSNQFTLRYNFDPVTNTHNSYASRDRNNSTLCRISQEQAGLRERAVIDSPLIYSSIVADYVLDWLVDHFALPSYYVEYDCFQPLFITLNLGDNITITDSDISDSEITATVEKLELEGGRCRIGVRLWLLYDKLGGAAAGMAGSQSGSI